MILYFKSQYYFINQTYFLILKNQVSILKQYRLINFVNLIIIFIFIQYFWNVRILFITFRYRIFLIIFKFNQIILIINYLFMIIVNRFFRLIPYFIKYKYLFSDLSHSHSF